MENFEALFTLAGYADTPFFKAVAHDLLVFTVAWALIKQTIAKHFNKIELNFDRLNGNLESLRFEVVKLEKTHSTRIEKIEQTVEMLTSKIEG